MAQASTEDKKRKSSVDLYEWDPEDDAFWESEGKSIAKRNLWISIPNLLCGFSVWLYWGMIAKIIRRVHQGNPELFNFTFGNDGQPYGDDLAAMEDGTAREGRCCA